MKKEFKAGDIVISERGRIVRVTAVGEYNSFSGVVLVDPTAAPYNIGSHEDTWAKSVFRLHPGYVDLNDMLDRLDKLEESIKSSL